MVEDVLTDRAIPIELDGERGGLAPFAVLDDIADRARVAYIGEMDHFITEKYDLRLLCIRYLASRGWRWFGEEWAADRGRRADEYLRAGDDTLLDPVDEPAWFTRGILANDRQPDAALDAEQKRFMQAVRRVTPDDRVRTPGGGAGPGGDTERSIGHFTAHDLTDEPVLSFWFLHGTGTSANPWLPPPAQLTPSAGTFDAELLARVGRPCLVPVGDDHHRRSVTAMHDTVLHCRFAEQVDAIVFVPEVHPLRGPS